MQKRCQGLKADGLRERVAAGRGVKVAGRRLIARDCCVYGGGVNAETPPCWGGVSDAAGEPDDYLLSHG